MNKTTYAVSRRKPSTPIMLALCFVCNCLPAGSQTHSQVYSFGAAVIKRADRPATAIVGLKMDQQYLWARFVSLRYLITQAFGVEDYRLRGTADWMDSERYSVEAQSSEAADRSEMLLMLRDLLVTRFHLVVHHESQEMPVFALVIDKHGPKLPPLGEGEDDLRFFRSSGDRITRSVGSSIQDLVEHLNSRTGSAAIGRPVIDRTGLRGLYRIHLTFEVELNADGKAGKFNIDYPSALVNQLGLRLEPTRAAINLLVVDGATRPTLDE